MTTRLIIIELIWFIMTILISSIAGYFFLLIFMGNTAIDIHIHGTYFVLNKFESILPFILLFLFGVYIIRTFRNRFSNNLTNWITLFTGIALVSLLTKFYKLFVEISLSGFTIYPPLSQFKPNSFSEIEPHPMFDLISKLTFSIQIIVLITLTSMTYRWGKTHRKLKE